MLVFEIIMMTVLMIVGIMSSATDIKYGKISNRLLLGFAVVAVILDALYYGLFDRTLIVPFIMNNMIVMIVALFLFYSHSFAGGDTKLTCVLALLYPAGLYTETGGNKLTLFFTIGFAILYGYGYMLISSFVQLIRKKNTISADYIKQSVLNFIKAYIVAMIYISLISLLSLFWHGAKGIIGESIIRVICLMIAWAIGRLKILKKWYVWGMVLALDIVLSIMLKTVPFSLNPENYILVTVLLLCQITIGTYLYKEIDVKDLQDGMILSIGVSMLMQNSRIRGLPGISSEDLKSRLTASEVDSIKKWAEDNNCQTITIVRKIPFAVFLLLGYISYFIIWNGS